MGSGRGWGESARSFVFEGRLDLPGNRTIDCFRSL